jgi:hypothetical protein
MGNGSTQPASCGHCSLALPSYASQSDTSSLAASRWPDTDGIAFATSAAGGKRVWGNILGTGETFDIQPHLTSLLRFFFCVRVLCGRYCLFFSTLFLLLIQFVYCSNDLFGNSKGHVRTKMGVVNFLGHGVHGNVGVVPSRR